ncbi:MAG: phytanoyl-CoA dioxygenase family protein [Planctomycetaceae bacterium]|nr:phytanoyl-CoA dioxygenase family protein [Planctomycetaceae bacterium]
MQLDPKKYSEYWENGWTIVEKVFTTSEVEAIADLATRLCRDDSEIATSSLTADQTEYGAFLPRKLEFPFKRHPDFRVFVLSSQLRALVEQLIGKPALLVTDQVFMKPPRFGSAKPYHQDNAYFLCHPDDEVLTAWIALDDVDEQNGCLRYIDGSHRGPILEHVPVPGEPHNLAPAPEQIDLSRESLACVRKGGVVFHHSKTLHTSHRNESANWRRAYASHWASADVTSEVETIDRAYYNQCPQLDSGVTR